MTDASSKAYLTISLEGGHIKIDVGNHATSSYSNEKFRPFECQDAAQWLVKFDDIDWGSITLRASCACPAEHGLGPDFDAHRWISHVAHRMRLSRGGPCGEEEEVMDEKQTENIVAFCVECKTHYTTSRSSFESRCNACPECKSFKACRIEDIEDES